MEELLLLPVSLFLLSPFCFVFIFYVRGFFQVFVFNYIFIFRNDELKVRLEATECLLTNGFLYWLIEWRISHILGRIPCYQYVKVPLLAINLFIQSGILQLIAWSIGIKSLTSAFWDLGGIGVGRSVLSLSTWTFTYT